MPAYGIINAYIVVDLPATMQICIYKEEMQDAAVKSLILFKL